MAKVHPVKSNSMFSYVVPYYKLVTKFLSEVF